MQIRAPETVRATTRARVVASRFEVVADTIEEMEAATTLFHEAPTADWESRWDTWGSPVPEFVEYPDSAFIDVLKRDFPLAH